MNRLRIEERADYGLAKQHYATLASPEGSVGVTVLRTETRADALDLWVRVPTDWVTSDLTTITVYARVGSIRMMVAQAGLPAIGGVSASGTTTTLAFSVRGVAVDSFEVVLVNNAELEGDITFYAMTWVGHGDPSATIRPLGIAIVEE